MTKISENNFFRPLFAIECEGWEGMKSKYRLPLPHEILAMNVLEIYYIRCNRINALSNFKNLLDSIDDDLLEHSIKIMGNRKIIQLNDQEYNQIMNSALDSIVEDVFGEGEE